MRGIAHLRLSLLQLLLRLVACRGASGDSGLRVLGLLLQLLQPLLRDVSLLHDLLELRVHIGELRLLGGAHLRCPAGRPSRHSESARFRSRPSALRGNEVLQSK